MLPDQAIFGYDNVTIAHTNLLARRWNAVAVGCMQISGIRPDEVALIDCDVAGLVLGEILELRIGERLDELAKILNDAVPAGDLARSGVTATAVSL